MNKRVVVLWLPVVFLHCSPIKNSGEINDRELLQNSRDKSFNEFFDHFCASPRFQLSRIKFPLKDYYLEPGEDEIRDQLKEHEIEAEDWEYINFKLDSLSLYTETDQYTAQIKKINRKTVEYIHSGIDNGINVIYYFEREKHYWYLTKIVDTSY